MKILFLLLPFLIWAVPQPPDRPSKNPFISGDAFRDYADYAYDELDRSLKPSSVLPYSSIFVKTDFLKSFFETVHEKLKVPYVLITHNSDASMPGDFAQYLDDKKLLGWFGQNWDGTPHPKIHPIPIGIANYCWPHGDSDRILFIANQHLPKTHVAHMSIDFKTFPSERFPLIRKFTAAPYCRKTNHKPFYEFIVDVASADFEIAPRGNGLDTHRLWEALYLGTVPIVRSSPLDPLYEELPVLIIPDWDVVNEKYLRDALKKMRHKKYAMEKLWMNYWIELIEAVKRE